MMHWDFYTYESQPLFFIQELVIFLNQESLREKDEAQRVNSPVLNSKGGMKR
jgi:hypothetical protein